MTISQYEEWLQHLVGIVLIAAHVEAVLTCAEVEWLPPQFVDLFSAPLLVGAQQSGIPLSVAWSVHAVRESVSFVPSSTVSD